MPGVQICRFSLPETDQELQSIPVCGAPLHFEVFFCLSGRLMAQPLQGISCTVQAPGIFLLSDSSPLRWCRYRGNLGGILIAVDARAARESLAAVCSSLGNQAGHPKRQTEDGCKEGMHGLSDTPWTQAFWDALPHLTGQEQERYCVFKSVELLYLLCAGMSESEGFPLEQPAGILQSAGSRGIHSGTSVREAHHYAPLPTFFCLLNFIKRRLSPCLRSSRSSLPDSAAPPARPGADPHNPDAHPADCSVCGI